ncbi:MAG: ShlB/FhaC/HecB family hemolysin secretion/activation protein, partial [Pseudomonadota bacterium]|nr:ShlB/FhaC/HecB family hemolysin secretion/activation protein [Pseudomonadota bacterium]
MTKRQFLFQLSCFLLIACSHIIYAKPNDTFKVKQFKLIGNTEVSTPELLALLDDYQGRELTAEELQTIKNILTQYYIDQGYLTTFVTLPDQTLDNGIMTLEIIEDYPTQADKRTLSQYGIRRRLQIVPQNYWCQPIADRLRPTVHVTGNQLYLREQETRPYLFNINLNNYNTPSLGGGYQGELSFIHYNFLGQDDVLNLCYERQEQDNEDYSFNYSIPLVDNKTFFAIGFGRDSSKNTEEPFKQIDIESESEYGLIALRHLFYNDNNQYLLGFLRLQRFSRQTFLLGRPFPFSPGVSADGETAITTVSVGHEWKLFKSRVRTLSTYSAAIFGLDAFGATINDDDLPDSRFFSLNLAFSWLERLRLFNSRLFFHTSTYYTEDGLLPPYKISLGGAHSVRGYRENTLVKDRRFLANLEWQIPIT